MDELFQLKLVLLKRHKFVSGYQFSTKTKTRNAIGRSGSFPSIPYRFADRTRCRVESVSTGGGVHFNDCGADRKTAARYAFGLWRGIPYRYLTAGRGGIIM